MLPWQVPVAAAASKTLPFDRISDASLVLAILSSLFSPLRIAARVMNHLSIARLEAPRSPACRWPGPGACWTPLGGPLLPFFNAAFFFSPPPGFFSARMGEALR